MLVRRVFGERARSDDLPKKIMRSRHSSFTERTNRSAYPCASLKDATFESDFQRTPRPGRVTLQPGPLSREHQTLRVAAAWSDYVRKLLEETRP